MNDRIAAMTMGRWTGIGMRLAVLTAVSANFACIPSFPPCDCTVGDGDGTAGPGDFPDFAYLDRSAECADIPLPGAGDGDGDGDGDGAGGECGYPAGPYGFEVGDTMENLELFDCEGNQVQLAQYIPQIGLPDNETRGVIFGVGAAWCQPCQVEATEWAENFVDEWGPQGIQFLQALDEGSVGAATMEICAGWSTANAHDAFPILFTPTQKALQLKIDGGMGSPLPFTLAFNANANIVFRQTGEVVPPDELTGLLEQLISDPYAN